MSRWTQADQDRAEAHVRRLLAERDDADTHPRVVASLATENFGNVRTPRGPARTGRALDLALTSGRYDRWSTVVWRARLAGQVARSIVRRERITGGTS